MQTGAREVTRRRLTSHEDDRTEPIDGGLVEVATIGTQHFDRVNRQTRMLVRNTGDLFWHVHLARQGGTIESAARRGPKK